MAMNRTHMRRQLYSGGGITSIPRVGYGAGSWLKKKIRNLIPNEIADVAVKAAPFVAPFNPAIAGLMRGIGRFDQRGSISDALKQGALTYGGGQAARYLGGAGMQQGFGGGQFTTPMGPSSPISKMWGSVTDKSPSGAWDTGKWGPGDKVAGGADQSFLDKILYGKEGGTGKIFGDKGLIGKGGGFDLKGSFGKGVPAVFAGSTLASLAVQAASGDLKRDPGESLTEFNKKRKGTVSKYLDFYFRRANKFRIAPEEMDAAAAKFVEDNTEEYVSEGGRIGYQAGGPSLPPGGPISLPPSHKRMPYSSIFASKQPGSYTRSIWELASDVNPYDVESTADLESYLASAPRYTDEIMKANRTYPSSWRDQPIDPHEYYLKELALKQQSGTFPQMYSGYTPDTYKQMVRDVEARYNEGAYSHAAETGGAPPIPSYDPQLQQSQMKFDENVEKVGQGFFGPTSSAGIPATSSAGIPATSSAGIPATGISMSNTLAQNVAANQAQAAANQKVLQAARDRINPSTGGRIGLRFGTPEEGIKSLEAGAPEITYKGDMTPMEDTQTVDMEQIAIDFKREHGWDMSLASPEMIIEYIKEWKARQGDTTGGQPLPEDPTKPVNPFAPKPTGPVLPDKMMAAQGGRIGYDKGTKKKDFITDPDKPVLGWGLAEWLRQKILGRGKKMRSSEAWKELNKAQGGRIKYNLGTMDPRMAQAGLPSIPGPIQMAEDGPEYDMSQNGGFQPLGAQEGKDDVKANLAKNEFVFTADAVRAAGGGDIELGAQKMYDTMKNLERRVV